MRLVVGVLLALGLPAGLAAAEPSSPAVAFVAANGDVVLAAADGSDQRVVAFGGTGSVVWSPDGAEIAFSARLGPSTTHLLVGGADGSAPRDVTPDPAVVASHPTWSPDGTEIAYAVATPAGGNDLWVVAANGGEPRRITTDAAAKTGPWWAPAGSALAFDEDETIATVDTKDGVVHKLASGSFTPFAVSPWSPDGSLLAFTRRDPDANRVVVIGADGSGERVLSPGEGGGPEWSPDGRSIVYTGTRRFAPPTQELDVFAVSADGNVAPRRLTGPLDERPSLAELWSRPEYSPDGSQIDFLSHGSSVWTMNPDGTCERRLDGFLGSFPSWRPGASAGGSVRCVDIRVRLSLPAYLGFRRELADITVENDGNEAATAVTASIGAPGAAQCVPECRLAALEPGESRSIPILFHPTQAGRALILVTVADRAATDIQPDNNTSTAQPYVLPCTILGDDGANHLVGTSARDRICGRPGPDRIDGRGGNDLIDAGSGNDLVVGGPGRDTVLGRGGRDVILARDGEPDWIDCGSEYDVAVVDRFDVVRHCEHVVRSASP